MDLFNVFSLLPIIKLFNQLNFPSFTLSCVDNFCRGGGAHVWQSLRAWSETGLSHFLDSYLFVKKGKCFLKFVNTIFLNSARELGNHNKILSVFMPTKTSYFSLQINTSETSCTCMIYNHVHNYKQCYYEEMMFHHKYM